MMLVAEFRTKTKMKIPVCCANILILVRWFAVLGFLQVSFVEPIGAGSINDECIGDQCHLACECPEPESPPCNIAVLGIASFFVVLPLFAICLFLPIACCRYSYRDSINPYKDPRVDDPPNHETLPRRYKTIVMERSMSLMTECSMSSSEEEMEMEETIVGNRDAAEFITVNREIKIQEHDVMNEINSNEEHEMLRKDYDENKNKNGNPLHNAQTKLVRFDDYAASCESLTLIDHAHSSTS